MFSGVQKFVFILVFLLFSVGCELAGVGINKSLEKVDAKLAESEAKLDELKNQMKIQQLEMISKELGATLCEKYCDRRWLSCREKKKYNPKELSENADKAFQSWGMNFGYEEDDKIAKVEVTEFLPSQDVTECKTELKLITKNGKFYQVEVTTLNQTSTGFKVLSAP